MKLIIVFISLLFMSPNTVIEDVMEEFHSLLSKKQENSFLKRYEKSKDPSVLAYVITLEIKQAEYAFSPLKKYNIFNTGKAKLEALVSENPKNMHLRYMRYLIQKGAPSFLGYKDNLVNDAAKIKSYLAINIDSDSLSMYIQKNCSL